MSKSIQGDEAVELVQKKCLELLLLFDEICKENNIRYWLDHGTLLGAVRHKEFISWDDDLDVCLPIPDYHKLIGILAGLCKEDNPYILYYGDSAFDYCYNYFGDVSFFIDGVYPIKIDLFPIKMVENNPEAIKIDKSWANVATVYFKGAAKKQEDILPIHTRYLPTGKNLPQEKATFFKDYQTYMLESYDDSQSEGKLLIYSFNDSIVEKVRDYFLYEDVFPLKPISFEGHTFIAPNNTDKYLSTLYANYMDLPPIEVRIPLLTVVHKSNLSKKQFQTFFDSFFYMMMSKNIASGKSEGKWNQMWIKGSSFLMLFMKLVFTFQFKSARNFIRYAKTKSI